MSFSVNKKKKPKSPNFLFFFTKRKTENLGTHKRHHPHRPSNTEIKEKKGVPRNHQSHAFFPKPKINQPTTNPPHTRKRMKLETIATKVANFFARIEE